MERGLFEDKVANLWCTATLAIRLRERLTQTQLLGLRCATQPTGTRAWPTTDASTTAPPAPEPPSQPLPFHAPSSPAACGEDLATGPLAR